MVSLSTGSTGAELRARGSDVSASGTAALPIGQCNLLAIHVHASGSVLPDSLSTSNLLVLPAGHAVVRTRGKVSKLVRADARNVCSRISVCGALSPTIAVITEQRNHRGTGRYHKTLTVQRFFCGNRGRWRLNRVLSSSSLILRLRRSAEAVSNTGSQTQDVLGLSTK